MQSARKAAKAFKSRYSIRKVSAKTLSDAVEAQGYTVIMFNRVCNNADVAALIAALGLETAVKAHKVVVVCDRQDSYGAGGGNLSLEIKALLKDCGLETTVLSRIYGIGGCDFYVEEAEKIFYDGIKALNFEEVKKFDYVDKYEGRGEKDIQYFMPLTKEKTSVEIVKIEEDKNGLFLAKGGTVKESLNMPRRITSGHGACPGCGIPINVNLLLKGISGNVVLLFHTGCGMVVTTAYPKTSFKVNYVHNLFQNGGATLSGLVEMFHKRVERGEIPDEDYTFIMVSGDGGLDIGLGSALGAGFRNHGMTPARSSPSAIPS